ncbi:hypothetical protein LXL04_030661 [Taraxacum kok-saghyz]
MLSGIDETQEEQEEQGVGLEGVGPEGVEPEEPVRQRPVRQRKPSQRITLMKLKTRVVHKDGLGMSQEKPFSVE